MPDWEDLDWQFFNNVVNKLKDFPENPGVYAVRCAPNGQPKSIGRAFGVDKSGILSFGRATGQQGLKSRLRYFCQAAAGKESAHAEGQRYHKLKYDRRNFPLDWLQIGWKVFDLADDAKEKEIVWFDEYLEMFGELPPLNRRRG